MQRIAGAILLAVMTGIPVAGTVCAVLCSPISASTHHGPDAACVSATSADIADAGRPADHQLARGAGHDCGDHYAVFRRAFTGATDRSALAAVSPIALPVLHPVAASLVRDAFVPPHDSPPEIAPPATKPLVLRI